MAVKTSSIMIPAKFHISNEHHLQINSIIVRLQNSVNAIQIINWLHNFKHEEWDSALKVLEAITYYNESHIINEYDEGLIHILKEAKDDEKIYVHGYGELGKSGTTMLYFFRQTPTYKSNKSRFKILADVENLKRKRIGQDSRLILLDDIIGSGKTLSKFFSSQINFQLIRDNFTIKVYALCIAYMLESVYILKEKIKGVKIIGSGFHKAFTPTGSVFGYRPRMIPIREFCYKHGVNLFSLYDRDLGIDVPHALGYSNSQSLLIFAHSVPNNTLPIIWSNKNGWYPLFPRAGAAKISETKRFKEENYYWLNLAYALGIMTSPETKGTIYTKDLNFGMIAILRLKMRKSTHPKIFQTLGISVYELEKILAKGKANGLFDKNHDVTPHGVEAYESIRKKIKISQTDTMRKLPIFEEQELYVSKTFGGLT